MPRARPAPSPQWGEGWGEGVYELTMVRFPLTPTLSPLGRGSPAVPQIESVPITSK